MESTDFRFEPVTQTNIYIIEKCLEIEVPITNPDMWEIKCNPQI